MVLGQDYADNNLWELMVSDKDQLSSTARKLLVYIANQYGSEAVKLSRVLDRLRQDDIFASYSREYLRKLMYELVEVNALSPVGERGWYRLGDGEMKAGPYHRICRLSGGAVAYHTALYFHGLTDHYPKVYYARTRRTLPGDRTRQVVDGIPLIISVTSSEVDYELGLEIRRDQLGDSFEITSKEKTYIDLLRAPDKSVAGFAEVASSFVEFREELDLRLLSQMAFRLKSKSLLKRVGYLLELVGRNDLIQALSIEDRSNQRNWSRLDLSMEPAGIRDQRWHLDVNVDGEFLLDRLGGERHEGVTGRD